MTITAPISVESVPCPPPAGERTAHAVSSTPRSPEIQQCDHQQGNQQHGSRRSAVTKTEEAEGQLVGVDGQHSRRIDWAAAGHHVDEMEKL